MNHLNTTALKNTSKQGPIPKHIPSIYKIYQSCTIELMLTANPLKKITIFFSLLVLIALIAINGFQLLNQSPIHIMNGKLMEKHQSANNTECHAQNCLINTKLVILPAAMLITQSTLKIFKLLTVFALTIFSAFILFKIREYTVTRRELNYDAISIKTVIFRE